MSSRTGVALIAFLFHGPGLRLLTSFRMSRSLFRANLVALGITLAAMAYAGAVAPVGSKGAAIFLAWIVGHFGWSAILSFSVLRAA
jgi:hypothetical protein